MVTFGWEVVDLDSAKAASGPRANAELRLCRAGPSLSGILCARHSMTNRSMYAYQQEDDEGGDGRSGGDAVDPEGTH